MISQEYVEDLLALNRFEGELRQSGVKARRRAELEVHLAEVKSKLPTALVSHHESMVREGRESLAVVTGSGTCGACDEKLPVGMLAELSQPGCMAVCPRCGTLVFKEAGGVKTSGRQ